MMNIGIIYALAGVVCLWIAMTAAKFVAKKYDNFLWLFFQYVAMSFFAFLFVVIVSQVQWWSIWPTWTLLSWSVLAAVWLFWFAGIYFLFRSFEKISGWIALTIANVTIFLQYFANLYLFDSNEALSRPKILLAIAFFLVVAKFMVNRSSGSFKRKLKKWSLRAVGTAICRWIFFVGNAFLIKNDFMTPVQTVFYTEFAIFLIAIVAYMVMYKNDRSEVGKTRLRKLWPYAVIWAFNVGWQFLLYTSLVETPANVVNVIRLFGIVTTALFCRIFLNDRLSRFQIGLMAVAMIILIGFMVV